MVPDDEFLETYFGKYDPAGHIPAKRKKNSADFGTNECSCNHACSRRFPRESRRKLSDAKNALSEAGFEEFLSHHIILTPSPDASVSYYLPGNNVLEQVCRDTFMSILQVTERQIQRTFEKKQKEVTEEVFMEEMILEPGGQEDKEVDFLGFDEVSQEPMAKEATSVNGCEKDAGVLVNGFDIAADFSNFEVDLKEEPFDGEHAEEAIYDSSEEISQLEPATMNCQYLRQRGRPNGQVVPARQVKPACNCRMKCGERYPPEDRQGLLDHLLSLSRPQQKAYLSSLICQTPRMRIQTTNSRRGRTNFYFLPLNAGFVKVCKEMFKNTFDIPDRFIREAHRLKGPDGHVVCGIPNIDKLMKMKAQIRYQNVKLGVASRTRDDLYFEGTESCDDYRKPKRSRKGETEFLVEMLDNAVDVESEMNEEHNSLPSETELEMDEDTTNDECEIDFSNHQQSDPTRPSCNCRMKCGQRVPLEARQRLRDHLLSLNPLQKREFLSNHICNVKKKRCRSPSSRRERTFFYFLPLNSGLVKVCRVMFLNTFDVGSRTLRTVRRKGPKGHIISGNVNMARLLNQKAKIKRENNKLGIATRFEDSLFFAINGSSDDLKTKVPSSNSPPPTITARQTHVRNLQKERGLSYTRSDGTVVPARAVQPPCSCPQECYKKVPSWLRQKMLRELLKLPRLEQKRSLCQLIQMASVDQNSDDNNGHYVLQVGITTVRVCEHMFRATFDLQEKQLQFLIANRDRLLAPPKDPAEVLAQHVASFAMHTTHLCPVSNQVKKLLHCPNAANMYNQYLEQCRSSAMEPAADHGGYFAEFNRQFMEQSLALPVRCDECGFFEGDRPKEKTDRVVVEQEELKSDSSDYEDEDPLS